jgi:hypothetical protein
MTHTIKHNNLSKTVVAVFSDGDIQQLNAEGFVITHALNGREYRQPTDGAGSLTSLEELLETNPEAELIYEGDELTITLLD